MDFLHKREYLHEGDVVVVDCSHRCNIWVTNDTNFSNYKNGRQYRGYGGGYTQLPARIPIPSTGYWNITLDLGGGSANIRHSIQILKA
ncbi:DUF1883 domain-containing protein [Achromobacter sp. AONIH1]|nr:DUF1883 domain-containing protein [Achromobacter sp. AONIH1]